MPTAPEVFQALADPARWAIVRHLADGPRCVCELNEIVGLPQSTLSTQLQVLRSAGVLVGERRGRWMYYGIARQSLPFLRAAWKHFPDPPSAAEQAASGQPTASRISTPSTTDAADCCRPVDSLSNKPARGPRRPLKTKTSP